MFTFKPALVTSELPPSDRPDIERCPWTNGKSTGASRESSECNVHIERAKAELDHAMQGLSMQKYHTKGPGAGQARRLAHVQRSASLTQHEEQHCWLPPCVNEFSVGLRAHRAKALIRCWGWGCGGYGVPHAEGRWGRPPNGHDIRQLRKGWLQKV